MLVVEGAVVVMAEAAMLSGVLRGDFVGVAEVEESCYTAAGVSLTAKVKRPLYLKEVNQLAL